MNECSLKTKNTDDEKEYSKGIERESEREKID